MDYVSKLISGIAKAVINPLIYLLFALALLRFAYGVALFVKNADSDADRRIGQRHMLWGVVGMAIMVSVFGIIHLITDTLGISAPATIPSQ